MKRGRIVVIWFKKEGNTQQSKFEGLVKDQRVAVDFTHCGKEMPFANEPIGSHRVADQLYGDCGGGGRVVFAGGVITVWQLTPSYPASHDVHVQLPVDPLTTPPLMQ